MPTDGEILALLDEQAALDWPEFAMVSSMEYLAMRLVVVCERATGDWGLVFELLTGSWLDDDDPRAIGVGAKRYGPSVPSHAIHAPRKRPSGLTTTAHDRLDLALDGVVVSGPAGALVVTPALIAQHDLRPGRVCNLDRAAENPADLLLVRAYLARHPGSLFGSLADAAAQLGGSEPDVLLASDAFEHGPRPSESATYRSRARALATRDATQFVPGPSNLDWREHAVYDDDALSSR